MKSISMIIGFLTCLGFALAIPITEHDAGSITFKREPSQPSFDTGAHGLPYAPSPMIFAGTVGGYDIEFNGTIQEIIAHAQTLYPDIIFDNATSSASNLVPRNKVLPPLCCPVAGQVRWGLADPTVISSGIRYLQNKNSGPPFITGPCGVAATSCVRISCSYDAAIWLCNDNNYAIYPACTYLATYAQDLINDCLAWNSFYGDWGKASLPLYTYKNLPGPRWIRLLEIPALADENEPETSTPISCRLITASLDDDPSYNALSYSWDGQIPDRILNLRDDTDLTLTHLLITQNCDEAIRALQKRLCRESPLRIWIDAISINQANLQERNSQVSMMGDIYKFASVVRMWLGPATSDSSTALVALIALAVDGKIPADKINETAVSTSLINLALRPYWQRVWTLQEVGFASVAVVHIGDESVKYETLARGSLKTENVSNLLQIGGHFNFTPAVRKIWQSARMAVQISQLIHAQLKLASDPRDKIYAVRSLMPNMFQGVVVDYGKSVQEVYTDGTRAIFEHTKRLEVLFYRSNTILTSDMPSWAIDWSNTDHLMNVAMWANVPESSLSSPARITFSSKSQVMNIYGKLIDTVEHVHFPLSRMINYKTLQSTMGVPKYLASFYGTMDINTIRDWVASALWIFKHKPSSEVIAQISKLLDIYNRDRADFDPWMQMMTCDIPHTGWSMEALDAAWQSKVTPEIEGIVLKFLFRDYEGLPINLPIYAKILMNLFLELKEGGKLINQHHNVLKSLGGQRFFITSQGHMGIGDPYMKKGDQIMVFEGAFFPMIVRSIGAKNIIIGSARVPSLDIDALLEDKNLLEMIQIS